MNIGLGLKAAVFARSQGATQAQVNQQAAVASGSNTARDKVTRDRHRDRALKLLGGSRASQRVAAVATKVAATKKA